MLARCFGHVVNNNVFRSNLGHQFVLQCYVRPHRGADALNHKPQLMQSLTLDTAPGVTDMEC